MAGRWRRLVGIRIWPHDSGNGSWAAMAHGRPDLATRRQQRLTGGQSLAAKIWLFSSTRVLGQLRHHGVALLRLKTITVHWRYGRRASLHLPGHREEVDVTSTRGATNLATTVYVGSSLTHKVGFICHVDSARPSEFVTEVHGCARPRRGITNLFFVTNIPMHLRFDILFLQSSVAKIGLFGSTSGDNCDITVAPLRLETITVHSGDVIDALSFTYKDHDKQVQTAGPWGGSGGSEHKVTYYFLNR
ncbi:hypothetical protein PR202_gn00301 [Eleusine coracana subsp. coracana]|uniref:Jacalin-type lectin domain-containing protein n=1 Tax=Eleusine coracana subsp. coracana TaxID=191504 RepID=A0AAV5G1Z3_ELECO|nr:hypothetical protein PR202_gn00196 [Eleusine coracana subsp. coracana]GJN40984.1 hypothetical protein PR202_gn00301 [Eleusine coracana subsp. coracana]